MVKQELYATWDYKDCSTQQDIYDDYAENYPDVHPLNIIEMCKGDAQENYFGSLFEGGPLSKYASKTDSPKCAVLGWSGDERPNEPDEYTLGIYNYGFLSTFEDLIQYFIEFKVLLTEDDTIVITGRTSSYRERSVEIMLLKEPTSEDRIDSRCSFSPGIEKDSVDEVVKLLEDKSTIVRFELTPDLGGK